MSKIIVTGGSGFIGTNLIELLSKQSYEIINIDISPPQCEEHSKYWRQVDICDFAALNSEISKFDPIYIVHLAAKTDLNATDIAHYKANTDGVLNLVKCCNELKNIKKIIFTSSMLVCKIGYIPVDNVDYAPTTIYGKSKVIGESIVRQDTRADLPWLIIRPTSIWGPWFNAPYRDFFSMIYKNMYFHPYQKRIRRSYGFVLNSVYQIERLLNIEEPSLLHNTIYLCDYLPLEIKEWADLISEAADKNKIIQLPYWSFAVAALIGDLLKVFGANSFPLNSFRLENLCTEMTVDTALLREVCGDLPYTVRDGVLITCKWLEARGLVKR